MAKEEIKDKVIEIMIDNFNKNIKSIACNKYLIKDYKMEEIDYILAFADIDYYFHINTDNFIIDENIHVIDHTITQIVNFIYNIIK